MNFITDTLTEIKAMKPRSVSIFQSFSSYKGTMSLTPVSVWITRFSWSTKACSSVWSCAARSWFGTWWSLFSGRRVPSLSSCQGLWSLRCSVVMSSFWPKTPQLRTATSSCTSWRARTSLLSTESSRSNSMQKATFSFWPREITTLLTIVASTKTSSSTSMKAKSLAKCKGKSLFSVFMLKSVWCLT